VDKTSSWYGGGDDFAFGDLLHEMRIAKMAARHKENVILFV
jgi:hypothetical protein